MSKSKHEQRRTSVKRRTFLKLASASAAGSNLANCGVDGDTGEFESYRFSPLPIQGWSIDVLRPRDLLSLRFEFIGLQVSSQQLVKSGSGPYRIIVHFPSQAIAEEAFPEPVSVGPTPPIRTLIGGPSRLVFAPPESFTAIPYTLSDLLLLISASTLVVSPWAKPPTTSIFVPVPILNATHPLAQRQKSAFTPANANDPNPPGPEPTDPGPAPVLGPAPPPTDQETAIELPFRLFLSPHSGSAFAHRTSVPTGTREELWHTRLGVRTSSGTVDETNDSKRTVRALDNRLSQTADPLLALNDGDRSKLVSNTSDFPTSLSTPNPIQVERLMLTTLGGYLHAKGTWEGQDLVAWDHHATLGRDHFVRVVYAGYLFPFGHEARLVKITERKIVSGRAYLLQRGFIVITELSKSFTSDELGVPMARLTFTEPQTPDIDLGGYSDPEVSEPPVLGVRYKGTTTPYLFPTRIFDQDGRAHTVQTPAVFVPSETLKNTPETVKNDAQSQYDLLPDTSLGRRYSLSPSQDPDDGVYEVQKLRFIGRDVGAQPYFVPGMDFATVTIDAMRALAGDHVAPKMKYAQVYLDHQFDEGSNLWQAVLEPYDNDIKAINFSGKSQNSGGFVAPGLEVRGLSRSHGPIGTSDFGSAFDPMDFFANVDVTLFGAFSLFEIIDAIAGLDGAPKFISQALETGESIINDLLRLDAALSEFSPTVVQSALDDLKNALDDANVDDIVDAVSDLQGLITQLVSELDSNNFPGQLDGPRRVAQQLASSLADVLGQGNDVLTWVRNFFDQIESAKNLTTRLEWRPTIKSDPYGFFVPQNTNSLILSVEARAKDQPGKKAGVDLTASLENFDLVLFGDGASLVTIAFERLQFRVSDGKKPEIDVIFKDIGFLGVLKFVETLSKILPYSGFSDPPDVQVTEEGIVGGFTLPIPNVALGIFSLENMAITAEFRIPFVGPPMSVYFGFCSRESPFTLTVSMLGGGGFFGITITPKGIDLLEAAFEFGASLSVDFGVASGAITVMAGFYFGLQLQAGDPEGSLIGYFRMRGEVNVLGLISASIELRLELEYKIGPNKLIGRASIEIEVNLLFFSASVSISVERRLAGSNDDPTLADLMTAQDWQEYAAAFAA